MHICFGETLKRLRRERGMTQEQLAAVFNVSFQTISKWERDESYPDLTVLPALAEYFGVRTDDLLGIDRAGNERRIQEIIDTFELEAGHHRRWAEQKEALKAALKEFPGEYRLWVRYLRCMLMTSNVHTVEERRAFLPELEPTFENIQENCTSDAIRIEAKQLMCCIYHSISALDPENSAAEQAAAERIIGEMPALRDSREYLSTYLLYPRPGEQTDAACHEAIMELLYLLRGAAHHLSRMAQLEYAKTCDDPDHRRQVAEDPLTQERMQILRSMIDVYDAVFPDGDYGKNYSQVIYGWSDIALWRALMGDPDGAFDAMGRAAEIARRFDALPRVSVHTSPMLRGKSFDKFTGHTSGSVKGEEGMCARIAMLYRERFPWPEAFREDARFAAAMDLL